MMPADLGGDVFDRTDEILRSAVSKGDVMGEERLVNGSVGATGFGLREMSTAT